jgi:hypothetical protein
MHKLELVYFGKTPGPWHLLTSTSFPWPNRCLLVAAGTTQMPRRAWASHKLRPSPCLRCPRVLTLKLLNIARGILLTNNNGMERIVVYYSIAITTHIQYIQYTYHQLSPGFRIIDSHWVQAGVHACWPPHELQRFQCLEGRLEQISGSPRDQSIPSPHTMA